MCSVQACVRVFAGLKGVTVSEVRKQNRSEFLKVGYYDSDTDNDCGNDNDNVNYFPITSALHYHHESITWSMQYVQGFLSPCLTNRFLKC